MNAPKSFSSSGVRVNNMGDYDDVAKMATVLVYAGMIAIPVAAVAGLGGLVYLVCTYTIVPR